MGETDSHIPDLDYLCNLLGLVWSRANDKNPVEEVGGEAMGSFEPGASDGGDTTVRSHYNQWGKVGFEGAVEKRKTFDVEHMDFVDEENL